MENEGRLRMRNFIFFISVCQTMGSSEIDFENLRSYRSGMDPTAGFLRAERVLQRFRGVRGQDDAAETGRRVTP